MSGVVIIGGGIAGISAAASLAPHVAVTLLEAETSLAYHASGRSAAMFLENYGNDTVRVLNRASAAHHHEADGGVLKPRGILLLGRPDEGDDHAAEAAAFGMETISPREAASMVPILDPARCAHAAFLPEVFDIDTDLLIQNYRRAALSAGAQIRTGQRVIRIERAANGWRLHTEAGESLSADAVVNAAGAWADGVASMAGVAPLGIQPYRRSMARIAAPAGHDVTGWPFMDGVNERWYAKPDAGALIVSPSEEHAMPAQDAWADDMVLAEGLARYEDMVTTPVERMLANWAGLRTFAPDRTLVIGEDARARGFFWLAGQGGYGFQTAPAASRLLADLVLKRAPEIDAATVNALSPRRFAA